MKVFDVNDDKLTRTELEKHFNEKLNKLDIGKGFILVIKRAG